MNPVFEEGRQITAGYVAVFIYLSGQNLATVAEIPLGIVRPTSKEGDAIWSPANDQGAPPLPNKSLSTSSHKICSIAMWASCIC